MGSKPQLQITKPMQFVTKPFTIQVMSNQNKINSTSTHNILQMDEEQCRRLSFGVKPRIARISLNEMLQDEGS